MTFVDTGILVGAVLEQHPEHDACLEALEESETPFTDAHALAETFATLTGFYKVPVAAATELTLGLKSNLTVEPMSLADYERAIGEARQRGVMGGGIYGKDRRTKDRRSQVETVAIAVHRSPDPP